MSFCKRANVFYGDSQTSIKNQPKTKKILEYESQQLQKRHKRIKQKNTIINNNTRGILGTFVQEKYGWILKNEAHENLMANIHHAKS